MLGVLSLERAFNTALPHLIQDRKRVHTTFNPPKDFNFLSRFTHILHSPPTMSLYSLPEVETPIIPKERVITRSVDLSNDYGTPNLAFFYHVLCAAGDLDPLWKAVDSWNAWELAIAEEHVVSQLNKGNLPGDDSIPSRMKRSAYRGKVIATLREQGESPWYVIGIICRVSKSLTAFS